MTRPPSGLDATVDTWWRCLVGVAVVTLIALVGTGCAADARPAGAEAAGSSHQAASTPATSSGRPVEVFTSDGATIYAGVGAEVRPAPPTAVPGIDESAAESALKRSDLPSELTSGRPPSSLRLVMYENAFGQEHPNGSDTPSVPEQLAWLATYVVPDTGPISVPAAHTAPPRAIVSGSVCTVTIALSASNGAVIDAFQYCGTNPP